MEEWNTDVKRFVELWGQQVADDPGRFREMEWAALRLCMQQAGILASMVLAQPDVLKASEEAGLSQRPDRVASPRKKACNVRCPGGVMLRVETPYCPPKTSRTVKGKRRGREGGGVYPALAALGIFEGMTPLAGELPTRFSLLMPSFEQARNELDLLGHAYDVKAVRRVVGDYGRQALSARNQGLVDWRNGEVVPETTLRGRKAIVAFDGGRTRTRKKRKRSKKGKKRRYDTPWREPKLLIIYVVDEKGKRDPTFKVQIDGTMRGPDALMELAAYHLFRLGAGEAQCVEFVADGAAWIWDRIDAIIRQAGLDPRRCRRVLDIYHALEHLGAALEACGFSGSEKKKQLSRLKRKLLNGKAEEVLFFLQGYKGRCTDEEQLRKEITYFINHLHLLKYRDIRRKKLALGSGAIESAIRRVINLRVKSPSAFWEEDMVEGVIYMRAQLLSDRWDEMMDRVREHAKVSRMRNPEFEPTPMTEQKEAA